MQKVNKSIVNYHFQEQQNGHCVVLLLCYVGVQCHFHQNFSYIVTDAICDSGTAYLSGSPEFNIVISGVLVARFIVLCVMFCRSLFFLLSSFVWSLQCVSFFELRFLITPLGYWEGKAWTEITTKFYPFMFRSQLPITRSLTQVLV